MSDYVPYEERQRQERAAARRDAEDAERLRRSLLAEVQRLVRSIDTNAHVEVLRPLTPLQRLSNRKPVIRRWNRPCVIDEVVPAHYLTRVHPHPNSMME